MSKLVLTTYEDNKFRMNNLRFSPLLTWLHFFNFITIAVVCLIFLKIYKSFMILFEWLFSFEKICENPIVLVMGPNNEIVHELVYQLSQKFNSKVIFYNDVNDNYVLDQEELKKTKKSQLIFNHESINNQSEIVNFSKYIRRTYGFVDILVIVRGDDPVENNNDSNVFLNHLNKQLLSQFWTVMAFLPGMMRRNSGRIISIALGKSPITNTGIMRTIFEDLLQRDTKVKLTLVERNTLLNFCYSCLPIDVLVGFILRSMWNPNSLVKVPSFFCLALLPLLLINKFILKPTSKFINFTLSRIPL